MVRIYIAHVFPYYLCSMHGPTVGRPFVIYNFTRCPFITLGAHLARYLQHNYYYDCTRYIVNRTIFVYKRSRRIKNYIFQVRRITWGRGSLSVSEIRMINVCIIYKHHVSSVTSSGPNACTHENYHFYTVIMFNVDKCRRRIMVFAYMDCNVKVEGFICTLVLFIQLLYPFSFFIVQPYEVYTPYAAPLRCKMYNSAAARGSNCTKTVSKRAA